MENPLLPVASNAIGATFNPTFPTGPANIITPQIDAGHGLSGSSSTIGPLIPSGSGSKGDSNATNLTSANSQTGHSGFDRLTGLPAEPGRTAKATSSGGGSSSSGGSSSGSYGSGGSSSGGSNSGSYGSGGSSSGGSGSSSGSSSSGGSGSSSGSSSYSSGGSSSSGSGSSSGSSSSGGNGSSSGGSSSGGNGSSTIAGTISNSGLPANNGVGSTTSFMPLYQPIGSVDKLTRVPLAGSSGNLITPIASPVKPIPSPILINGSGDKIIPNASAGGVGNNSNVISPYVPIPSANQYTGYSGNPWSADSGANSSLANNSSMASGATGGGVNNPGVSSPYVLAPYKIDPYLSNSGKSSGGTNASNLTISNGNSASGTSTVGVGNSVTSQPNYNSDPYARAYVGSGDSNKAANFGNTNSNAVSPPVVMPPNKPQVDLDVSLQPKGLLPPVEKKITITIPITSHTPEGKPIYARTTLPDGVTRDEKTGVVNGILPPEGFYDVINKSLWFTGRVVDGSAGGNSGSNDISAPGASGGVGGSSSGNSSSSGYSAVSAVVGALNPATNSSPAVATSTTSKEFSDDRGQTIVLDKQITLSGQTLANVFNGGNPVVTQTNVDGIVSVTNGASSGSSILANGNTKTDLSTRAPFANPSPSADKPSGLLNTPNPPVNLPLPGTTTSAIGTTFSNSDGQSITFDKPTALTNKDLADLFNNGKPVVTEALANGTVRVIGDQSASTSNLNATNGNLPYAQSTAPTSANNQATQPAANPGLVAIPKELLNPPSDTKSSLIPLIPFITPSTQAGKDATGTKFTDDRGQIITLGNSTTLSAQTLAKLFNNGNSVVAQTKPNGDVSLVDSAKQSTQNAYDALGNLVFKDPAPAAPTTAKTQPANPSDPLNDIVVTYTNVNGDARILVPSRDLPQPAKAPLLSDKADTLLSSGGRDLSKGIYNSSPETINLIAYTQAVQDIEKILKDIGTSSSVKQDNPIVETLGSIVDYLKNPNPLTENPLQRIANGAIAVGTDTINSVLEIGNAARQFAQDPVGTIKYGAIGSVQSFAQNVVDTFEGWKWAVTKPTEFIESVKQYYGETAQKEQAEYEKDPGAYIFRKARDIFVAVAPELGGSGKNVLTKTVKTVDNIGDGVNLVKKTNANDALQPTKSLEPTSNPTGAIDLESNTNGQYRDPSGKLRDANGQFALDGGPKNANNLPFDTTTVPMRTAVQGVDYLDPITNKITTPGPGVVMSPDHIFPVSKIVELPNFDKLTLAQQKAIIQDTVGIGNIQPLPKSLNESKGAKLGTDWKTYDGGRQTIDPTYAKDLGRKQGLLQIKIQDQINAFVKLNP